MDLLAQGAQNIDLGPQGQFSNLRNVEPTSIVEALVTFVLIIAALAFFFWLVLGGIKWITSGGDKAQTEAARNQITAALIGLVIVFSSWALIQILGTFFGVDLLNVAIPNVTFTS